MRSGNFQTLPKYLATATFLAMAGASVAEQTASQPTREDVVTYGEQSAYSKERISIRQSSQQPQEHPGLKRLRSPQGTAVATLDPPDYMVPGPWNTAVYVSGNEERPIDLVIYFSGHANGGVRCEWLNEKILFLQVWWGRIVSTDMILDVQTRKFIYLEDADYGQMIRPGQ